MFSEDVAVGTFRLIIIFFGGYLPSFAFFLLAKVPPSFPKKESSFFLEVGDLGVGDLGEEGDFWGEEAIVVQSWTIGAKKGLKLTWKFKKRKLSTKKKTASTP